MNRRRQTVLVTAITTVALAVAVAAQTPVNSDARGVAIDGYDPVAYFAVGEAQRGRADHTVEWNEATWYFTSAANAALFRSNPEHYAPQFGGYCAWAAAQGYVAGVDPQAWTVHNGRLYLNFSAGVRRRFVRDLDGNIAAAERNWPGLAAELAVR